MLKPIVTILLSLTSAIAQGITVDDVDSLLPKPYECGRLNETYLEERNTEPHMDEFPWIGKIVHEDKYPLNCQAVLISKRYAITIASCQTNHNRARFIVFGDITSNTDYEDCHKNEKSCPPGVKTYDFEDVGSHSRYDFYIQYNIAILRLKEDAVFSSTLQPICLPPPETRNNSLIGQFFHYVGFGYPIGYITMKGKKMKALQQVVRTERCLTEDDLYKEVYTKLPDSVLCMRCYENCGHIFDEGGALMAVDGNNFRANRFYLVGLQSHRPGFVTNVAHYLEWIMENMY